jgi:LmbE family N-acetylglucosaminyl deacetylase
MTIKIHLLLFIALATIPDSHSQQKQTINVLVIGAHPDDCDSKAGGTAYMYAHMGHKVRFVSLCNGNKGHYKISPDELAAIRKDEAREAGKRFGVDYVVLDYPDGELMPTLQVRNDVIRQIREWKADIVITHRPNDYHADHRYTSAVVQDAAYMVIVPNALPEVPALKKNPVFLYCADNFKKPLPFAPDIVVDITDVVDKKIHAMMAHKSQYFDWLPWTNGNLGSVPKGDKERAAWLLEQRANSPGFSRTTADGKFRYTEAFEISEYGRKPYPEEIKILFPMIR